MASCGEPPGERVLTVRLGARLGGTSSRGRAARYVLRGPASGGEAGTERGSGALGTAAWNSFLLGALVRLGCPESEALVKTGKVSVKDSGGVYIAHLDDVVDRDTLVFDIDDEGCGVQSVQEKTAGSDSLRRRRRMSEDQSQEPRPPPRSFQLEACRLVLIFIVFIGMHQMYLRYVDPLISGRHARDKISNRVFSGDVRGNLGGEL